MPNSGDRRPHLIITRPPEAVPYGSKGVPISKDLPYRDRQAQGNRLLAQLREIGATANEQIEVQRRWGLVHGNGVQIQFSSEPGSELALDRFDLRSQGIELLSSVIHEGRMLATVFVPEGKLSVFLSKVEDYLTRDTKLRQPSNQALVAPISEIRQATLKALWTDESREFPEPDEEVWWEVWLRKGNSEDYKEFLMQNAQALGLTLTGQAIEFVERVVLLVRGTATKLAASISLLAGIAEVRGAKDTASMYSSMSELDQGEWIDNLVPRITSLAEQSAAVCILDTGLNSAHPLLEPLTDAAYIQAVDPAWGVNDHDGHGTAMAGAAAFGDLTPILQANGAVTPRCHLESCKILPPTGANDPLLYGAITRAAVALAEIAAPLRKRVLQTAVTAEGVTTGRPSSWSAEIDALASGAEDNVQRLFVLSVGNVPWATTCAYPDEAHASACEDPSQAWNALAVGGYTEKMWLDTKKWPDDQPIAPPGALCPESRTSLTWEAKWPVRPDIVMEAGNLSVNSKNNYASDLDDLALLGTGHQHLAKPLIVTRGTSPAGAQAAGLAAEIMSSYPNFWPETVRGLLVHSSDWTDAMRAGVRDNSRSEVRQLLRTCGWGVPSQQRALYSAADSLTLIAQQDLRPFKKEKGKGIKFRDMHLHRLPWPVEALQELFDTQVELRVTLSYFVEPSPGMRGYSGPFVYASHGLRFELQGARESESDFRLRVNVAARDADDNGSYVGDARGWILGPHNRNKGSLHSDRWVGTATDLASRQHLAIFPVAGWWRTRPHLERVEKRARYALLVSVHAPAIETDLYAEIQQKIAVPIPIEI